MTVVDDYAHLPDRGRRRAGRGRRRGPWGRVVAVFQPQRYSRTAALWRDFADCLRRRRRGGASPTSTPPGERPVPGVTGKLLVDAVLEAHPWARVAWLPDTRRRAAVAAAELRPGDLCLTLGAGDLTTWRPASSPAGGAARDRRRARGALDARGRRCLGDLAPARRAARAAARPTASADPAALFVDGRLGRGPARGRRAAVAGHRGADPRGGQGLEPAGRRRRLPRASPSCWATAFARDRRRRHPRCGPGAPPRCRSWPAAPSRAGLTGLRVGGRRARARSAARCG